MQHVFMSIFLFCLPLSIWANETVEDKIATIIEETKISYQKSSELETDASIKRAQASALRVGETKLDRLKSFYLNRHLFDDANKVKEALVQFKATDFSNMKVATTEPEIVKKESPDKSVSKALEETRSNKKSVDYNDFKAMGEDEKKSLVDKFVFKGEDGYWTVTQGRYTVKSDVSASFALEQAIQMSDFYNAFERIFKKDFKSYGNPSVYVTNTRSGFFKAASAKGLRLPPWSGGVYTSSQKMMFTYLEDGEKALKETLYHEGTHQLVHYNTGRHLPPWINEGLATNFETWEPYQSEKYNTFEAQFKSRYLKSVVEQHKRSKLTKSDFRAMLEMDGWQWNGSSTPELNYSRAWSIVNFLLSSTENFKYLDLIYSKMMIGLKLDKILSEGEVDKLAEMWILDIENRQIPIHANGVALYEELLAWIQTNKYKQKQAEKHLYELGKNATNSVEYQYLESIHYAAIGDFKEAVPRLEKLLKMDRTFPFLYSVLGYCYKETGKKNEATSMFLSAIRLCSADPIVGRCK